jgi:hypothetical protein
MLLMIESMSVADDAIEGKNNGNYSKNSSEVQAKLCPSCLTDKSLATTHCAVSEHAH